MLKIVRALVFLEGYRAYGWQQYKTTVEVAGKVLGKQLESLIGLFDKMRRKRNQFTYDPMLPLSLTEAKSASKAASDFHKKVSKFLDEKYPQLKLFE